MARAEKNILLHCGVETSAKIEGSDEKSRLWASSMTLATNKTLALLAVMEKEQRTTIIWSTTVPVSLKRVQGQHGSPETSRTTLPLNETDRRFNVEFHLQKWLRFCTTGSHLQRRRRRAQVERHRQRQAKVSEMVALFQTALQWRVQFSTSGEEQKGVHRVYGPVEEEGYLLGSRKVEKFIWIHPSWVGQL